jgi:hypothetical protein
MPSLRSAEDLKGGSTERMKRVKNLNICIIYTQGIVGVGAFIRIFTA